MSDLVLPNMNESGLPAEYDDSLTDREVRCRVCPWYEEWSTIVAAQSAAVWHVHDAHPREWLRIVGERPPKDPKPEMLGKRRVRLG